MQSLGILLGCLTVLAHPFGCGAAGFFGVSPWIIPPLGFAGLALYVVGKGGIPLVWRRSPVAAPAGTLVIQTIQAAAFYGIGYGVASLLR